MSTINRREFLGAAAAASVMAGGLANGQEADDGAREVVDAVFERRIPENIFETQPFKEILTLPDLSEVKANACGKSHYRHLVSYVVGGGHSALDHATLDGIVDLFGGDQGTGGIGFNDKPAIGPLFKFVYDNECAAFVGRARRRINRLTLPFYDLVRGQSRWTRNRKSQP